MNITNQLRWVRTRHPDAASEEVRVMTGRIHLIPLLAASVLLVSSPHTLGSEPERQLTSDTSMRFDCHVIR